MKQKQFGFATLEIIVGLIIVALLGFIGWNFVQQSTKKNTTTTTNTPTPSSTVSTAPKADPNTLTLTDWNVMFTIPDSLKTTSIKYAKHEKDGTTYYGFTTRRIQALGGDCKTQPYGESVKLYRMTDKPSAMYDGGYVIDHQVGAYYYVATETIPACSGGTDVNAAISQVEIDDRAAIMTLLKTVTPIQ